MRDGDCGHAHFDGGVQNGFRESKDFLAHASVREAKHWSPISKCDRGDDFRIFSHDAQVRKINNTVTLFDSLTKIDILYTNNDDLILQGTP
jgi:hypothetical protein